MTESIEDLPWYDAASDPYPRINRVDGGGFNLAAHAAAVEGFLGRLEERRERYFATPEGAAYRDAAIEAGRVKAEDDARRKRIERAERLAANAIQCGVPNSPRVLDVVCDDHAPVTPSRQVIRDTREWWRKNGEPPFAQVLCGPVGTGKTCALARFIARLGPTNALYLRASSILDVPRNGYSENSATWTKWVTIPWLAIDELGSERPTEKNPASVIFALVTERYDAGNYTFLAGNLSAADILARYCPDDRFTSRVVEEQGHDGADTGLPWFVDVKGPSYRIPANRDALLKANPPPTETVNPYVPTWQMLMAKARFNAARMCAGTERDRLYEKSRDSDALVKSS